MSKTGNTKSKSKLDKKVASKKSQPKLKNKKKPSSKGTTLSRSIKETEGRTESLDHNILTFLEHIEGINISQNVVMPAVIANMKKTALKLDSFLDKNAIEGETHRKRRTFSIPIDKVSQVEKHLKDMKKAEIAFTIIPSSLIVMLVSQFDFFVGRMICSLFKERPELLNTSDRQMSLSQLVTFNSLEHAKNHFLEKEIDSFLRKSHAEQFSWLEKTFNLTLRKDLDMWPEFIELTERRNLFVHTNGIISSQYIDTCIKHNVKNANDIKLGEELSVDYEYFSKSYKLIYELGVKLSHVLWRKIIPSDLSEANINYNQITFNLLGSEQYDLAAKLLDFLFITPAMNKFPDDSAKRIHILNRAMAYKWKGNNEKCLQILDEEDWSSTKVEFLMAVYVLKEKYPDSIRIMEELGDKNRMFSKNAYLEWPIFKEFRKTKTFQETFSKIFGTSGLDVEEKSLIPAKEKV